MSRRRADAEAVLGTRGLRHRVYDSAGALGHDAALDPLQESDGFRAILTGLAQDTDYEALRGQTPPTPRRAVLERTPRYHACNAMPAPADPAREPILGAARAGVRAIEPTANP